VATLDNIISLLEKWPVWKRITEAPDRIDRLESQIESLKAKLTKPPKARGEPCRKCGEHAARLKDTRGPMGDAPQRYVEETWACEACGGEDIKHVKI